MIVFDEKGAVVEKPDLERGRVETKSKAVFHSYVVDAEEVGHWEVVATYPETGGEDVEWRIDTPEVGRWETRDDAGEIVEHFDGAIDEAWPKEQQIPDVWSFGVYLEYTPNELDEIKRQKDERTRAMAQGSQMMRAASLFVQSQTMERVQAVSVAFLYPEWSGAGVQYQNGAWVQYRGDLYRVETPHASQESWTPDAAPSLFTRFKLAPDGVRVWERPTHAENAFDTGERCHYPDADSETWVSKIDGNTTEPGSDDRWWARG